MKSPRSRSVATAIGAQDTGFAPLPAGQITAMAETVHVEAARIPVRTHIQTFAFDRANDALFALKNDAIRGAGVLIMD